MGICCDARKLKLPCMCQCQVLFVTMCVYKFSEPEEDGTWENYTFQSQVLRWGLSLTLWRKTPFRSTWNESTERRHRFCWNWWTNESSRCMSKKLRSILLKVDHESNNIFTKYRRPKIVRNCTTIYVRHLLLQMVALNWKKVALKSWFSEKC